MRTRPRCFPPYYYLGIRHDMARKREWAYLNVKWRNEASRVSTWRILGVRKRIDREKELGIVFFVMSCSLAGKKRCYVRLVVIIITGELTENEGYLVLLVKQQHHPD